MLTRAARGVAPGGDGGRATQLRSLLNPSDGSALLSGLPDPTLGGDQRPAGEPFYASFFLRPEGSIDDGQRLSAGFQAAGSPKGDSGPFSALYLKDDSNKELRDLYEKFEKNWKEMKRGTEIHLFFFDPSIRLSIYQWNTNRHLSYLSHRTHKHNSTL